MKIFAHRGCSKKHGDNNMESFKAAASSGSCGIEMDVCITRDGVPVLNHAPVEKTSGIPIHTRRCSDTDLRLETVFKHFSGESFDYLVDIKDPRVYSDICRKIYELATRYECIDRCIFGSFNDNHLLDLVNIEKGTGSTLRKAYISSNMHEDLFASIIDRFRVGYLVIYKFLINHQIVNKCRDHGVQVFAYTCNTSGLYEYVESLGCDGMITDTPGEFVQQK